MLKNAIYISLVTILAIILVGIKIHPEFLHIFSGHGKNSNVQAVETTNTKKNNKTSAKHTEKPKNHRDPYLSETFPFRGPEEKKLAEKYPDQFNIVKKMYYAWDNIQNANGEYVVTMLGNGQIHGKFNTDFIKGKNKASSETLINGKVVETENILLKNGVAIREMPEKHIYTKLTVDGSRYKSEKSLVYDYLGMVDRSVTRTQWWILIYDNYPSWHYKIGKKFGMDVYEIEGKIPYHTSTNLNGPFTMIVSKKTGALLDLKCYGHSNKVVQGLSIKNIEINKGIKNEDKVFQLDLSGDTKVPFKEYGKNSYGMQAVQGKKTGGKSDQ